MSIGNSNGRPSARRFITRIESATAPLRRHPYRTVILVVIAAATLVFIVESMLDFPPFLAFAGAVGVCFVVLGVRPGLLALVLSAVVSDFLFIEPLWTFTRHSFVLAAYYLAAASAFRFFARRFFHDRAGMPKG